MEYKQRKANLIADNGKEEYDYAPIPDTEINNVEMNTNNMEEQIQATMGSSPDTNDTEVEMIDPTENDLVTPEMQMLEVLDTKDKLVAQHDNSVDNKRVELHTLETANKATQSGDTKWLHSEGFIPVVNKKLAASKKNKKIKKS
ncbi:6216_t:CDS:2, partial [Gigaspora margarita]